MVILGGVCSLRVFSSLNSIVISDIVVIMEHDLIEISQLLDKYLYTCCKVLSSL